jgi:hypothetical protein
MTPFVSRRAGRLLLAAAAVVVLGLAARAASGSSGASPSTLAAQLAARASTAKTAATRYQALLAIARALGFPVFTAAGKALSPGSRALPASFNLYDFQLRVAADSQGRHDTMTIAGLAQLYGQSGVKLDAGTLARQLSAGVRSTTARPSSQASLLGLVIRDLGLHHRPAVDLARTAAPTTELDPLQVMLIAADSAAHARGGRTLATASRSTDSCTGSAEPGSSPAAVGPSADRGLLDTILIVQATEVTVVNTPFRETHYGPPGHAALAGKELRLGVHAEIEDKLPDAVKCGLLDGSSLPPPGPRKHANVFWRPGDLLKYGTIEFEPADMTTGDTGTSTLVFKPKTEDYPGFGTEYKSTGDALATIGGPSTATVGLLTASQSWTVGYHKPRGFKFQLPTFSFVNKAGKDTATITVAVQGRVCGDDPFTKPWDITETVNPGGASADYPLTLFDNQNVTSGAGSSLDHQWTLYDQPPGSLSPLKLRLTITPGAPANGTFTPSSQTQEAYVFEDKTCPDNSDEG